MRKMSTFYITVLLFFSGCLALSSKVSQKNSQNMQTMNSCSNLDLKCKKDQILRYERLCQDSKKYSDCDKFSALKTEIRDLYTYWHKKAFYGCTLYKRLEDCQKLKPLFVSQCYDERIYQTVPPKDCNQTIRFKITSGTGIRSFKMWKNTPGCMEKKRKLQNVIGCRKVGLYEMKYNKNFNEAERIFTPACTSTQNNSGCAGVACVGKNYYLNGNTKLGLKLLRTACQNTSNNPGTYDGCEALRTQEISPCNLSSPIPIL